MKSRGESLEAREKLERLHTVVAEIVAAAEQQTKTRCPYKTSEQLCTFAGGCQNQRRTDEALHCGGDEFLKRSAQ